MFFFLTFRTWKVSGCFTLQSVCHVCFLVFHLPLLPAIFTSRILSNTDQWLEYFCYLVIRSNKYFPDPLLIKQFSYSFPIVSLILVFFIQISFSEFIMHSKNPQICSTQPKQPTFLVHNAEKNLRLTIHNRNNPNSLF